MRTQRNLLIRQFLFTILAFLPVVSEAVVTNDSLKFRDDEHHLSIYTDGKKEGRKPAILIVPEYWGKNELSTAQAEKFVAQGYVVMVLDLYGGDRHSSNAKEADKLQERAEADGMEPLFELVKLAIQRLRHSSLVDPNRVAAVGYGYGGGLVLNVIKGGNTGLKAAVSYYGGTKNQRVISQVTELPPLLYIRPELDVYTNEKDFQSFEREIAKSAFKIEVLKLKTAHYGFVNRGIENYRDDGKKMFMFYEPVEAQRAFEKTVSFLKVKLR